MAANLRSPLVRPTTWACIRLFGETYLFHAPNLKPPVRTAYRSNIGLQILRLLVLHMPPRHSLRDSHNALCTFILRDLHHQETRYGSIETYKPVNLIG
jgi:hypothetical protein